MRKVKRVVSVIVVVLLLGSVLTTGAVDITPFGSGASLHMNGGTGYIFNLVFSTVAHADDQTIVLPGNGTAAAVYSPSGDTLQINDQLIYVLVTDSNGVPIGTILPNAIGSRGSSGYVLQADGSMGSNGQMVGNSGTINFWFNGFTSTTPQPTSSYIVANKVWQNADGTPFTGTPPPLNFLLNGSATSGVTDVPMLPGVPVLVQDGSYTVTEPTIDGFQLISVVSSNMQPDLPGRSASVVTSVGNYTVTFTNRSAPNSTSLVIEGEKLSGGAAFDAGIFMFTATDNATGQVVATGTNTASTASPPGVITFTPITYSAADVGRTFTYTIRETGATAPNWTIDTTTFTVQVSVTLVGNDITATPTIPVPIVFNNAYVAPGGGYIPTATKVIAGVTDFTNRHFTFAVIDDATGNVVSTGINNRIGNIIFTPIIYTTTGVHNYTVVETTPSGNGWSLLPTGPRRIQVDVTSVTPFAFTETFPDGGPPVLTNLYTASTDFILAAHKTTVGAALQSGQFRFAVLNAAGNQIATGQNDASGTIVFTRIHYTTATPLIPGTGEGFYNYTIVETSASGGGWSTSSVSYPVLVRVTDNGNGTMTVTPFNLNTDNFVFVNTYGSSGSVVLEATKRVSTGDALADKQFEFAVANESGVIVATGSNDAAGKIEFSPINYTNSDVGVHHYTIFETSPGGGGWTPSSVVFHVSVSVVDNGNGTITATPLYPRTGVIFINTYDSFGSIALYATKYVVGAAMIDGQFSFAVLDENGVTVATGANDSAGNILFSAIPYRLTDTGTHNYTIIETTSVAPFWQMDSTVFNVSVTVTDDGVGGLDIEANYPTGGVNFTNTFTPPDRMLSIIKTITGFEGFNVFDPNSISPITFLVVGTNAANVEVYRQTVAFDSTNFIWDPNLGNYTYIMHGLPAGTYFVYEKGGFAPGYVNNQNLRQSATVSNSGPVAVTFNNIYTRSPEAPPVDPGDHPALTVNKVFHGLRDSEIPANFRIIVTGPNGFSTTINLSDAISGSGGVLTNLAPGTYSINEQNNTVPGFVNSVSINGQRVTLPYNVQITQATGHIVVTIDNTYIQSQPAPQTGVSRSILMPMMLLALGVVFIIGAEVYRRKRLGTQS